jgi:hypothetical protein
MLSLEEKAQIKVML